MATTEHFIAHPAAILPWETYEPFGPGDERQYAFCNIYPTPHSDDWVARLSIDRSITTGWYYWYFELSPLHYPHPDSLRTWADMSQDFVTAERALLERLCAFMNAAPPCHDWFPAYDRCAELGPCGPRCALR